MGDEIESRDQKYNRQTGEQFETLGRYVQAFEQMIAAVRFVLLQLTTRGAGPAGVKHQGLLNIVFHHQAMTAQPLFDILRAIIGEIINDKDYRVSASERGTIILILTQVAGDYSDVVRQRNDLIHGTWYIGWASSSQTDFSDMAVAKFKATKTGLGSASTPKNASELRSIIAECDRLGHLIRSLESAMATPTTGTLFGSDGVQRNFREDGDKWITTIQRG